MFRDILFGLFIALNILIPLCSDEFAIDQFMRKLVNTLFWIMFVIWYTVV